MIASTPKPPYYAVVFTSVLKTADPEYAKVSERMVKLAGQIDGFLGIESARTDLGITVSYWRDEASIHEWKKQAEHQSAQAKGRAQWYRAFKVRVCKVERDYDFLLQE